MNVLFVTLDQFRGDSWVEVYAADGSRKVYGLLRSGERRSVPGAGPWRVLLGKADHVRVTLQPTDAPPDAASMERVIDQIGSDEMFLFSTDYPHWHFDGTDAFPDGISPALKRRMLVDNPLATYRRLQEVHA